MQTQGHLTDQPGIRGHSYDPEWNLMGRFKIADVSHEGVGYIWSSDSLALTWEVAWELHEAGRRDFAVVDSGTGPWPTETTLTYF